jgi:hypothetical protein
VCIRKIRSHAGCVIDEKRLPCLNPLLQVQVPVPGAALINCPFHLKMCVSVILLLYGALRYYISSLLEPIPRIQQKIHDVKILCDIEESVWMFIKP